MSSFLGIASAKRNACAAICVDGEIRAACAQERLTRRRGEGLVPDALPAEAVEEVLALSHTRAADVTSYVLAESEARVPSSVPAIAVDHHRAHAATAFLTSPFRRAAILVCDSDASRELSVWIGDGHKLDDRLWQWQGRAFARLYSDCAELFELSSWDRAHGLEVLAHLGRGESLDEVRRLFRMSGGSLIVDHGWRARIDQMIQQDRRAHGHAAETASAVQIRVGELLLDLVAEIRAKLDVDAICLGGGLFYNTYFNTLVRMSGIFKDTFVPINPGNAGLSVGAPLAVSRERGEAGVSAAVSPFLGPEYDSEAIKTTLDGCKLSYEFVSEGEAQDAAVAALVSGRLVAWFQGRMEWGQRALGHRSILANPRSPYVLDNLNNFLRKRERSRPFGLSACEDGVADLFCGPAASPFMEYQYTPRDDRFRPVMPTGARAVRVQTVAPAMGPFWSLLKKMEQATGTGVLVNTSFNGFHEPIVCTPRDAIRVFYGTGLDMLVIGRFILRK